MAIRELTNTTKAELLEKAKKRIKLPTNPLEVKYQKDADLLLLLFSKDKCTNSKVDMETGLIYNYDAQNKLVSIEILDLYGIFEIV